MKGAVMDEFQLVSGCLQNDRGCQKALYERFAPKMLAVCMRYSASKSEAEDVMMEGFFKVFTSLKNFSFQSSLEVWVRSVMVHCAINNYNKNKRVWFTETIDNLSESDEPLIWSPLPDSISTSEVMTAIQKMPSYLQVVLNMVAFDGYSYDEVSLMLGISQVTVRTRFFRAKKWLQNYICDL